MVAVYQPAKCIDVIDASKHRLFGFCIVSDGQGVSPGRLSRIDPGDLTETKIPTQNKQDAKTNPGY